MQRTAVVLAVNRLFGMFAMGGKMTDMIKPDDALPGRDSAPFKVSSKHAVNGNAMYPPFPEGHEMGIFGMGCFWGVERKFWQQKGVFSTAAGYSAGYTKNPTYEEVCTGQTGHNEIVRVIFDPKTITYNSLLSVFWESHNPTQGMRQGNDAGTQYRSGIYYYNDEQKKLAEASKQAYQEVLSKKNYGAITTEILAATEFYYAEDYHQQYLHKNPGGYCSMKGTGVSCPRGLKVDGGKDEL